MEKIQKILALFFVIRYLTVCEANYLASSDNYPENYRGFDLCHQAVHNWVQTSGVELVIRLRARYQELAGKKCYVDTTYIRMEERWRYIYRAIDKEGYLVDTYLSDVHGEVSTEAFFNQSKNTTGIILNQVTTDKELALYPAMKNVFGNKTRYRDSQYINNRIERDHQAIKSRLKMMKGFKDIFSVLKFYTIYKEIQNFFRIEDRTFSEYFRVIVFKIQDISNLAALAV